MKAKVINTPIKAGNPLDGETITLNSEGELQAVPVAYTSPDVEDMYVTANGGTGSDGSGTEIIDCSKLESIDLELRISTFDPLVASGEVYIDGASVFSYSDATDGDTFNINIDVSDKGSGTELKITISTSDGSDHEDIGIIVDSFTGNLTTTEVVIDDS